MVVQPSTETADGRSHKSQNHSCGENIIIVVIPSKSWQCCICTPVNFNQSFQLIRTNLPVVGKLELECRACTLPLLIPPGHLQEVGQPGHLDDVLGVVGEGLHPCHGVEAGTGGAEQVHRGPMLVPVLNWNPQHCVDKVGKI